MPLPDSVPRQTSPAGYEDLLAKEERGRLRFANVDNDRLAQIGASIFVTVLDIRTDEQQRTALEEMLKSILNGEMPESAFAAPSMMPESVTGWVMFMKEFIERVQKVDAAQIPISAHVEVVPVE